MRIGVPREIYAGEKRVATTPDVAAQLIKLGFDISVESKAGATAHYSDAAYEAAGCSIAATADEIWSDSDIVLKVRGPEGGAHEAIAGAPHALPPGPVEARRFSCRRTLSPTRSRTI